MRLALDVGRTTEERQFKNMRDCINKTYQSNKLIGFYRGYFISIFGIILYRGTYFGVFEIVKTKIQNKNNFFYIFLAAQLTALTSGIISYPLDTIQKRLMMQNCRPEEQYSNIRGCVRHIWRHEGVKGFFKGMLVSLSLSTGSALGLAIYHILQQNNKS